jgi:hypothetical protein
MHVEDSQGTFFQYAFAIKAKYGRDLVEMKKDVVVRLVGTINRVGSTFVFLVDEIRR